MGGRAFSVEQSGGGEKEGARTDRYDPLRARSSSRERARERRILEGALDVAARNHQRVDRPGQRCVGAVGGDLDTARGAEGTLLFRKQRNRVGAAVRTLLVVDCRKDLKR